MGKKQRNKKAKAAAALAAAAAATEAAAALKLQNGHASGDSDDSDDGEGAAAAAAYKQSRGEKKARRLLAKLDLQPVPNVNRVAMRKKKNILLFMDQPDVYKVGETYVCFGEVKVDDIASTAAAQAAERFIHNDVAPDQSEQEEAEAEALAMAQAAEDEKDDPEIDEAAASELTNEDIELVQMQSNCSRKKAINALLENDNDVVNAIMALTVSVA
ncbi:nascent polypeptide-associated complex subunit alpha [Drosophila guanche]|uniref:Blast:Nascent polypeptide-associated complex subunit alpha n=1 Tax=Drosophila guanche TaxID=7266 RepID=A0A3B0K1R5_DROGU|nr:nascent polypeptide-associated complex subunit alpha [Drosophila guanche]SPP79899.1 blast:Nascent polypeptide-associated complex subunit alpha [Drosophila guanche]